LKISDHWIEDVGTRFSPNHSGAIAPELVVIHYTGDDSLMGAISWLCDPAAKVSAHLVISKIGEVIQIIPFNLAAWHAGKSSWDGRPRVNRFSIGIELVGTGDAFPDAQINALLECLDAICAEYEIQDIVGHDAVALPHGRKADPGPNFPWEKIRERYQV
jgi:N-acetylmuramoyl-L-alanine amidase